MDLCLKESEWSSHFEEAHFCRFQIIDLFGVKEIHKRWICVHQTRLRTPEKIQWSEAVILFGYGVAILRVSFARYLERSCWPHPQGSTYQYPVSKFLATVTFSDLATYSRRTNTSTALLSILKSRVEQRYNTSSNHRIK